MGNNKAGKKGNRAKDVAALIGMALACLLLVGIGCFNLLIMEETGLGLLFGGIGLVGLALSVVLGIRLFRR